ncbi:MAG: hypothetical protein Ct9H300mP3_01240 [Gammaproteobacteria bacterium]|nr:MAG: hypothetical protein Ct9H300mP3_01240 [Gammaproteobacteria bacterium]
MEPFWWGALAIKGKKFFEQWKKDIKEISKSENVFMKIGGMAMPDNGLVGITEISQQLQMSLLKPRGLITCMQ